MDAWGFESLLRCHVTRSYPLRYSSGMRCYNCQAANVPCVYEHTKLFLLVYRHGSEQSSFYSLSARRVIDKLREIPQDSTYSLYVHDMFTGEDTPLEYFRLETHGDFYLSR